MFTAVIASALLSANTATVEIRFTERDLVEPARVEMLQESIRRAASDVCDLRSARSIAERRLARQCAVEAEARASDQLRTAVARAGVIEVASAE